MARGPQPIFRAGGTASGPIRTPAAYFQSCVCFSAARSSLTSGQYFWELATLVAFFSKPSAAPGS